MCACKLLMTLLKPLFLFWSADTEQDGVASWVVIFISVLAAVGILIAASICAWLIMRKKVSSYI